MNIAKYILFCFLVYANTSSRAQIANYVSNGGFENYYTKGLFQQASYWNATDSSKFYGNLIMPPYVPLNSFSYQWPHNGKNYLGTTLFCPTCIGSAGRGYPRNLLKTVLKFGKVYCFTMYIYLTNQSSYGIDEIGVFFGDTNLDTILNCNSAIPYLIPQIKSTGSVFLTDTFNWVPITGTFVASGSEKYLMIGNFKSNSSTNNIFVNSANSPAVFADYQIDDVSLIEIDLPAYAGPDKSVKVGDSAFIGRQPDVGIDEACIWYKMTSLTTSVSIDTVAGLWVKPVTTTTYVVKQKISCGSEKLDTVVVFMDLVGLNENTKVIKEYLNIFPVPAKNYIRLSIPDQAWLNDFKTLLIYNNLGQILREEELNFKNNTFIVQTSDLNNGIYYLKLTGPQNISIPIRFIIDQ